MKRVLLAIIVLSVAFVSCNNNPTSEPTENNEQTSFWDKPSQLKHNFLLELKNNPENQDVILINFLSDYKEIVNEAYDTLTDQGMHEYSPELVNKLRENGFEAAESDESLYAGKPAKSSYVSENTTFIKKETVDLLNPTSLKFLNMYCDEIENLGSDDKTSIISGKLLVNSIFESGELLKEVKDSKYEKITKEIYNMNLHILFFGIEEYPAFDFMTDEFDRETYNHMKEIIIKYPNSNAAQKFTVFVDLLTNSDLKKNKEIEDFLENLVL
ncbi:MAG: hypothetical protein H8E98_00060 [Bacteroidetes bacterium]|nr:hypothetical protein [Bacteroidota bacterium]